MSRGPVAAAKGGTLRLLAEPLGVVRSDISVIRGSSSRDNTLLVHGLEPAQVTSAPDSHLG